MLACIKKDFYLIWGYCRFLVLVSLLFMLIPYFSSDTDSAFYSVYPRMFMGMIPLTLYTYDEREHWCSSCATLPISRRTYVLSKYALGLLLSASALVLAMVLNLFFGIMGKPSVALSLGLSLAMSLTVPAATMPFVFWLGAEKGRIVYVCGIGVGSSASVMLFNNTPRLSVGNDTALLLTVAVLYAASAALSVAAYERREL